MVQASFRELVGLGRERLETDGILHIEKVPENIDIREYLSQFGEFMVQPNGELLYEIKVRHGREDESSSGGSAEIPPHSEASYLPIPPKWVVLIGVEQSDCGGGATTVMKFQEFLKAFPDEYRDLITNRAVDFSEVKSVVEGKSAIKIRERFSISSPLRGTGDQVVRFSYNRLLHGDYYPSESQKKSSRYEVSPELREFCLSMKKYYDEHCLPIRLQPRSLLMWDNFQVLHGRTSFLPGRRRLLQRYWVNPRTSSKAKQELPLASPSASTAVPPSVGRAGNPPAS